MSKQNLNSNPAPDFKRSWFEAELSPRDKKIVTAKSIATFQKQLAKVCGMHIFCGPIVVAPDTESDLAGYYTNKKFKPRDWNSFTWWTTPDAKNVISILDHSHEAFYYYPEHNLIDISVATCKEYDLTSLLKFIFEFWKPNARGIRYALLDPNMKNAKWEIYNQI